MLEQGPVRTAYFGAQRIPFAVAPDGDAYCIDLNPESGGQVGQVVLCIWEEWTIRVVAESLRDFMEQGLHELRREQTSTEM